MTGKTLGVGLIGVEAGRSWSARAHIPALQALSDRFHIAGIANSSAESGQKAAAATGIKRAFASVDELVNSPDVDIVAVTVKVPAHFDLVVQAIQAGKHVYCEWPLGNGLDEAVRLERLAREKGVHGVIGTQGRRAPAVRYIRELIEEGFVGEVLSTTLVATGVIWGPMVVRAGAYALDVKNGATLLTIPFGHVMAAIADVLGEVVTVSAEMTTRRKTVRIIDTGEERPMTSPDQIIVAGILRSGAPIAVHYRGGMGGTGLLWEINGAGGNIRVTGAHGQAQLTDLLVSGARKVEEPLQPLSIPDRYAPLVGLSGPPANVAAIYADFAADLTQGTQHAPTFADAVRTHRLLAKVETAASTGERQQVTDH